MNFSIKNAPQKIQIQRNRENEPTMEYPFVFLYILNSELILLTPLEKMATHLLYHRILPSFKCKIQLKSSFQ